MSGGASNLSEDDLRDLVTKLQALLPQFNQTSNTTSTVSAETIVRETCNYIRRLNEEVEDLSHRLSQLLDSMAANGLDVDFIRRLLQP